MRRGIVLLTCSLLAASVIRPALSAETSDDGVATSAPGVTMDATNMGGRSVNVALTVERKQVRPDVSNLPVPLGYTRAHLERGDKVFHGEIARGQCAVCHGIDAKGTENGNDLTTGMYIWAEATVGGLKKVLLHNMSVAPGMDGDLTPADTEAVAAYIWALGRQTRLGAN